MHFISTSSRCIIPLSSPFLQTDEKTNEVLDENYSSELDPDVGAVVMCYDPAMSYAKVFKAINYLAAKPDCLFLASDIDASFPISLKHILPGTAPFVHGIQVFFLFNGFTKFVKNIFYQGIQRSFFKRSPILIF